MACLFVIQIEIQAVWILIGKRLLKNPVDASIFIVTHQKYWKDCRQGNMDMEKVWDQNISSGLAEI